MAGRLRLRVGGGRNAGMADPRLHPLHRLWRSMPTQARRRWLARATALLAPRPDWPPPAVHGGVAVAGEVGRASGLGEGARLMLAGLAELGVPSWALRAGLRVPGEADDLAVPTQDGAAAMPPGAALALHVNAPHVAASLLRLPRRLVRGRRVIGCWAWELPEVSPEWRTGVDFVHEAWVPSRFTAAAIEPLMPGRVRIVPYCVAARPPARSHMDRAAFGLPPDAVVVLVSFSLASSFVRKNPLAAIAAHKQAFGDRPDRVLVMKVGHAAAYADDMAVLREAASGAGNIRFETRTLPTADNHALIACADIVLSLHRSEGFGLVLAEAMLLTRATVATNWSGNTDFMDASCAAMVPYRLIPASDPRGVFQAPGAVWADADIGAAASHLARLADDPAARAALGHAGRKVAMERLGTAPLAAALRGIGLLG
jgi:glycosyltransferase involved in cell wall biosynthesis